MISTVFFGIGLQVYVDGEPVGFVSNQSEFEDIVSSVEKRASEILGTPYKLDMDVDYSLEVYNRRNAIDHAEIATQLFNDIDEISQLYVLSVNGSVVGANEDGDALAGLVDDILSAELVGEPETTTASLLCDVDITYGYTSSDNEESISKIRSELNANVRNESVYTVEDGDLFSDIAAHYGISTEELALLNPDIDPSSLIAGDKIVVESAIPLMSVALDKIEEYDEVIPYETEYVYTASMWKGDSYVETEGSNGSIHHVDKVEYVDDIERSRETISSEVTTEAVNEVIVCGTRQFNMPVKSYRLITSYFGWRNFGGSSDYHTGIDFANVTGTKIYASYGGTVSFAGWKGNYGNCVIIDHGYGYQTLYAHCSSLNVSEGDTVSQGDLIAYMGSTGRSTGSHCHFEIRINGNPVNPYNYIFN